MKTKQISVQIRNLIVKDRQKGLSNREIGRKYGVSEAAVRKIWKKFEKIGTVIDMTGRGRKRKTNPVEDRRIIRETKKNPTVTSRVIRENLQLNVSERTVRRRLREAGLKNNFALRRPLIRKANKIKRLEFAKKYADKPVDFWKKILWSDESKFDLFGHKQRARVWLKPCEKLLDKNVQKTIKHGGGSIMVWGCFAWSGLGNLVDINGIMTADVYINILNENLEESLLKVGLEDDFIFQQDNDPKHTAGKTTAFFRSSRIRLLDWPAQSPDLNPIENLWSILDQKVDKGDVTNKAKLLEALKRAWENIDQQHIQNLIESMPRRLQAVIQAKGGHTKY